MALVVQKFGGTSVGTPERIRSVAARIAHTRSQGNQVVAVVSAMGQTTDELIELAHRVSGQPPGREMDMLLTAGERISMALLSMALADLKVPAMSFTGSQTGIITDESHRRARIRRILGDRVRSAISTDRVAIIAGFQGVSESKEITTLGRGGSDTSAAALAVALKADICEIYTDVDGVFSADPRLVPDARLWETIPHSLMIELATRGAGVLHPRSVELAAENGIPLKVLSSLQGVDQNKGTSVVPDASSSEISGMEEFKVAGVTADKSRMLLQIELMRPTVLGAIWDQAAAAHLTILSPIFSDGRVYLFVERDAETEWRRKLEDLSVNGFLKSYKMESGMLPVSVVGSRFAQDGAALSSVMDALAKAHVSVTVGSASPLAITVAVPEGFADDAVKALHDRFFKQERS